VRRGLTSFDTNAQGRSFASLRSSPAVAGYVYVIRRVQVQVVLVARRPPCYPVTMKVAEVFRLLHEDGWYLVATRGSHRQFKHPTKPGRVTVAGKPSDDVALGILNSIRKQAGLK